MKLKTTLFCMLLPLVTIAQVPNGDLENWSGGLPVGWDANNSPGYPYVVQSAVAYSGNSSAKLQVVSGPQGSTGCVPFHGPKTPIHGIPTSFSFWYQFVQVGGDSIWLQANVYQPNLGPNVGHISEESFAPTTTWMHASLPWIWDFNPGNPDTVTFNLQLQPHQGNLSAGTYALFDQFTVEVPVGMEENHPALLKTSVYPTPASDEVYIGFEAPRAGRVHIVLFDLTGEVVMQRERRALKAGWAVEMFDMSTYAAGVYLAHVQFEDRSALLRIQVMR